MVLHLILFILFTVLGLFGLIFNVSEGVIVGTILVPWELRVIMLAKGKENPRLINGLVGVGTLVGIGFFILNKFWSIIPVFLLAEGYIYYVTNKKRKQISSGEKEKTN